MKRNLLLLHGALGSSKGWDAVAAMLPEEYNVFAPDFPGHGNHARSQTSAQANGIGMSIFDLVLFLQNYIEKNIVGEYFIAGYSMGGYVALRFAAAQPKNLKGIITIATKFDWSATIAEEESAKLSEENLAPLLPKLQQEHGTNFKDLLGLTQNLLESICADPLTKNDLEKITVPVVVALGDRDKMVTYEETKTFAGYLPQGRVELLVNQPHLLQKMDTEVLGRFIRRSVES